MRATAALSRSSPLSVFLALFIALPAASFAFLGVHSSGLEEELIPPGTAASVRALVLQARAALDEAVKVLPLTAKQCELGAICSPGANRPLLDDGTPSHAIWDMPRRLMKDGFRDVQKILPDSKVNYIWKEPLVVYYDNVLTDEEIDLIINTAETRFEKSMVVDENGKPQKAEYRTSDTAWIYMHEDPRYRAIVNKVAALSGFTEKHAEHLGVNRYRASQFFNPHYDYLKEEQLSFGEYKDCQRTSTVLIYLTDVEEGGETMFARKHSLDGRFAYEPDNPDHLRVTPKRGRVLVWYNMHPYTEKIDQRTLHGGAPVKQGEKMAATIFIRNCTRSPETENTPPIKDTTPTEDKPQNENMRQNEEAALKDDL